jgi:orotate phosphoribosyltransferase
MPVEKVRKVAVKNSNLTLRVAEGHFATSHSHINYYIDVTMQKTRLSEARAIASTLVSFYRTSTIIDTILCLDGMQVVGTCLADELTKGGFMSMNEHKTVYVITPEHTSGSQLLLRDNIIPAVKGKNVLILAASVTTGYTANAAIEAVKYYGGSVAGVSAIFATVDECSGYEVHSVFDPADLNNYSSYPAHQCPMCKQGRKIDALVNSHGYSKL